MDIIRIDTENADPIFDLFKRAIDKMIKNGINQWDEIYPTKLDITKDISVRQAFGFYQNKELIGYVVLNEDQPKEYKSIKWKFDQGRIVVIHRLCIDPKYQGRGLGNKALECIEKYVVCNEYRNIRLDAFANNETALKMYKRNNYTMSGSVYFRKGKFYCFEKKITTV